MISIEAMRHSFHLEMLHLIWLTRLAIHHFDKPANIVEEMARVCKPGGRVILVDITSVDDPIQVNSRKILG